MSIRSKRRARVRGLSSGLLISLLSACGMVACGGDEPLKTDAAMTRDAAPLCVEATFQKCIGASKCVGSQVCVDADWGDCSCSTLPVGDAGAAGATTSS